MSRFQLSLEVTRSLLNCAKATGFRFGENTALVAVQHMLRQTVDLFRTVGNMGLCLNNIFALGKVYSNSLPVMETLREMGVTVIESTVPTPGEFQVCFRQDINKLWNVVTGALSQRRIERILILDDGGVCITNVPEEILRRYSLCAVEQTSSGMFLIEESAPSFAVMSWARAAVKLEIGGPIFSHGFMDNFNTRFVPEGLPHGQPLGILGLGSIGKGIASLALRQGNEVLFYDPDPDLHIPSRLQKTITRADSLAELMLRCDYVVGCTGRNPFKSKWPLDHKPEIKLLSASGGDQEFGPIIKDLKDKPDFKVDPDTWDITSEHGPAGPIRIAYLGYPYNFVCRGPDAIPAQIVQLETSGLLAALVQARMYLDRCEKGQEYNRGIHRVSPKAQCFVYEGWLRAMNARGIDINDFGYEPETLQAAQHENWFVEKSEPKPEGNYTPSNTVEDMMAQFVGQVSRAINASEGA
jgi:hypothetical protein